MECPRFTLRFPLLSAALLSALLVGGFARAATVPPEPTWNLPGASGDYPLWDGAVYLDSARATGADKLWALGITGFGASAAVVDSPFQANHELFTSYGASIIAAASAGISLSKPGELLPFIADMDVVSTDDAGYTLHFQYGLDPVSIPYEGFEEIRHGTHVASTILGMAPGARLVLVNSAAYKDIGDHEADGNGDENRTVANLVTLQDPDRALSYIAQVAQQYNIVAVNNSYGGDLFYPDAATADAANPDTAAVLAKLAAAGVVPVFASGNESVNNAVIVPASMSDAIAIGALNEFGLIGEFSNQSEKVVLLAPGQNIVGAVPYHNMTTMTGTSMAAPHITGAIVLLASGAPNASAAEILQALIATADPVVYDGSVVIAPSAFSLLADPANQSRRDRMQDYLNFLAGQGRIAPITLNADHTMDEWREIGRQMTIINKFADELPDPAVVGYAVFHSTLLALYDATALIYPDNGPLDTIDYRFIRVDKAYAHLSRLTLERRAGEVFGDTSGNGAFLAALANEIGLELNQQNTDLYRRLDNLSAAELAGVVRTLGPKFHQSVAEYSHMGLLGIHEQVGNRTQRNRDEQRIQPVMRPVRGDGAFASLENPYLSAEGEGYLDGTLRRPDNTVHSEPFLCGPRTEVWFAGHAGTASRRGTTEAAEYDARFGGLTLGMERVNEKLTYGAFGSYSDFSMDSDDGSADGHWYSAGVYAGYNAQRFFIDASAAFNRGDYDTSRFMNLPGYAVVDPSDPTMGVMHLPQSYRADGATHATGASGRLAAGFEVLEGQNWSIGPRASTTLSWLKVSDFTERGAGVLDLHVDERGSGYWESGLGLAGQTTFHDRYGRGRLLVDARVMGLYGYGFGDDIEGRFRQGGTPFSVEAERLSPVSVAMTMGVTWKATDWIDVTARYNGRYASRYNENAGSLGIDLRW